MAKELKKGEHFEFKPIDVECKKVFLKDFLGSKINGIEGNNRHSIITEVFRCSLEMMESTAVLASTYNLRNNYGLHEGRGAVIESLVARTLTSQD